MNRRERELMTEDEISVAVALLIEARRGGGLIEALNKTPVSVAEGHAIQDRVTEVLGETVGGFKANAPPGGEPIRGLIYASRMFASPARIASRDLPHKGVEGEIAFRFLHDLPARDEDYARAEVVDAMVALPAIEVVSSRYKDPQKRPAMEQLADCQINGGLVLGREIANWKALDIANLQSTAWVNSEVVLRQVGGHPSGDPVGVAVALVNMMRGQGGVKAGQVVTTGSCTGLRFLKPGERFSVVFDGLGEAELLFVDA